MLGEILQKLLKAFFQTN